MKHLYSSSRGAASFALQVFALLLLALTAGVAQAQTLPVPHKLSQGTFTENFDAIGTWGADFSSGTGATRFSKAPAMVSPVLPTQTTVFSIGTSGGVQKGTNAAVNTIVLLATGPTDGQNAAAFDLNLDFSGTVAGTLSLDWASVNNSTGNRGATFYVQANIGLDNSFVEVPGTRVVITNNVLTSGRLAEIALPQILSGKADAKLRFFIVTSAPGTTGSRPKISLDNLVVTASADGQPTISAATVSNSSFCVTPSASSGSFAVAYTASGEFTGTWAVQLSNSSGTFPTDLAANLIGAGASPITARIPAGTLGGTGYRVRVVNPGPATLGQPSAPLSVTLAPTSNPVSLSPAAEQSFLVSETGNTVTAVSMVASTFQWFYGASETGPFTTQIEGANTNSFQPMGSSFPGAGTYYVVARAISSCGDVEGTSAPVKVNVISPVVPTLVLSTSSLGKFGTLEAGTASLTKSFTVEGTALSGDVTVTPAAGFEIRVGNNPFACCDITLTPKDGTLASTVIEVRFAPKDAQVYAAALTVSGGGAKTQSVEVSGMATVAIYPPSITTAEITEINTGSATSGGTVTDEGGSPVTTQGLVWSTTAYPTLSGSKTVDTGTSSSFTSNLSNLAHRTVYFVRAYATNAAGTAYGEQFTFTTQTIPLAAEPTSISTLAFSQVERNSLRLTLSGGNGTKRLVLAREAEAVDALPEDALAYAANPVFRNGQQLGTGNYVVFNGTGNEVDITGLRSGTVYHFAVFEYSDNETLGAENYLTTSVGRGSRKTMSLVNGLVLEENFPYESGTALTSNNWTAHSGGTNAPVLVTAEGLTYPDYVAVEGKAVRLAANGQDVSRSFERLPTGAPVYVSFLVNVSSAKTGGEYFFHLGPETMGSNFRARVFVRSRANGTIQFGVSGSTGTGTYTDQEYSPNTTYLLVVRYDFDANGNTTRLYVNPAVRTEPTDADASVTEVGTSPTDIGTVALRQGTNFPILTFDGLRVGISYGAVNGGLPLKVALSSFFAKPTGRSVKLSWEIAPEINFERFEVERSADGVEFAKIGQVEAETVKQKGYGFRDEQPLIGTGYYRLRQVAGNGASGYSQTVSAEIKEIGSTKAAAQLASEGNLVISAASVYPNPVSAGETLSLRYQLEKDGALTLQLFDGSGKALYSETIQGKAGTNTATMDMDNLRNAPAGLYVLHVTQGAKVSVIKIVKRN